ncbi:1582_t:CDS:2 [Ambispora gerdemannii]|uniref:Protein farnesyltransferase/geranylgeranyltransferase type-1 subunit alpha n=1 Tax=Ambispora gerdemannii TaxID=144530 RepID=A0A9N8V904_9GLOM|nr:1582_t:CDS:2 [Ambispora gerdemannii]
MSSIENFIDQPIWDDVEPIPQDDGPDPLAPIAYSHDYSRAMDLFRAITRKKELSERALKLTETIIELNPAHYTVWNYRQQILTAIDYDLNEELNFVDSCAEQNPKNYQVWHHRQIVVDKLNDSSRELPFINGILDDDSKNYHAWSYRQWIIKRFNLWKGELTFVSSLLEKDVRNNSAWNQRYFYIFNNPEEVTEGIINSEIEYAIEKIRLTPHNISPWNYIKGVIEKSGKSIEILENICKELQNADIRSPHLLGSLVDIYENRARAGSNKDKQEAIKICTLLADEHDIIRKKYWEYRKHAIAAY